MQQLVLVSFAIVVCTRGANIPAGLVAQTESRIVGGAATSIESHPWQVSVQRHGVHACGGTVYSSTIIITAAHCLQNITPTNLHVRAGSSNWRIGGHFTSVSTFKIHENYNPVTMDNDIALIRVTTAFFSKTRAKPIRLATADPDNVVLAVVSGWGAVAYGYNVMPDELQGVQVNIISRNDCTIFGYGNRRKILPSMICAAARSKNFCHGDPGSPLVYNNRLVGIASWNIDCGSKNYPGVYADIAELRTWIINNVSGM